MEGGLIIAVAKTGLVTLVVSKFTKAIGEKEISEIITAVGIIIIGVYVIQAFMPLAQGVQDFANNINNAVKGLGNIIDKLAFWR